MIHTKIYRRAHGCAPILQALPRRPINQIHTGTQPACIGRPQTSLHIRRGMPSVKGSEHMGHGGLHAERNPREPAVGKPFDVVGVDSVRIRLGRDFRVRLNPPDATHRVEHSNQVSGWKNRGRAAAEKHRSHLLLTDAMCRLPRTHQLHLANRHPRVIAARRPLTQITSRIGVEIAVPAAPHTKRHVDVHLERHAIPQSTSCRRSIRLIRRIRRRSPRPAVSAGLPSTQLSAFCAARILSFVSRSLPASPVESAAMNASCGTSTWPSIFMRFLPAFCFSSSLRLRVMSPP